jgi:TPR repeat protein
MKNLKYSLLLSAFLLVNIQICWAMIEEDTVFHEFGNSSISYRKGRFEFSGDNSAFYTKHHSPIITIPQCNQIDSFSQNGRRQITQTTEWPYRIHGNLTMSEGGITYGGSGVLIGPHHMLTAGHNVYSFKRKKWKDNISVRLGLHEKYSPFEERKVIKAYTFRQWVNNGDICYDMALLVLGQSIGNDIGYAGLLCLDDEGISRETVTITGYPGDYGFTKMMTMSDKVKTVKPEEFYYEINTAGGQSGSGIWINKCGSPYVLGVHTRGGTKEVGNSGARLSSYKFKKVTGWIAQNYALDNTSVNIPSPSPINNQYSLEDYFKVAIRYETGEGVQVNKGQAKRLYEFAAKKGHLGAFCKLGDLYYSGEIVSQNVGFSVQLYRLSAQKNYAEAQFNLGWMYENGQGVKQDQQEALKWYKLAAKQGHEEAINRIQVLEPAPKKTTSIPQPQKRALKTPTKKINKRSKKYIQHMKSLENQPKITQYFLPILKVNAN